MALLSGDVWVPSPALSAIDDGLGDADDVLADAGLARGDDERHAAIERVDDGSAVGDDAVRDLSADRAFDVLLADAIARVGPVEQQLDLVLGVAELVGQRQELAHVLDVGDLEGQHGEDHVGLIEKRERHVLEQRRRVDDHEVVRRRAAAATIVDRWSGVTSSAISGLGGAIRTRTPVECSTSVDSSVLEVAAAPSRARRRRSTGSWGSG